jgi:hypothetical protein
MPALRDLCHVLGVLDECDVHDVLCVCDAVAWHPG